MAFIVTGGTWQDQGYYESYSNPQFDAGARSVAELTSDGSFTFSVGQATGIVCGLNAVDLDADYLEIEHAFYIENGKVRVVENGVFKTAFSNYTTGAVFKIERIGGVVKYYVDSVLKYTSLLASTGTVFLDCSLFAANDTIILGELVIYEQLELDLPKPTLYLEEALSLEIELLTPDVILLEADGQLVFELPKPALYLEETLSLAITLSKPALELIADEDLWITLPKPELTLWTEDTSTLIFEVPKPTVYIRETLIVPDYSILQFSLPKPQLRLNEEENLSLDIEIPLAVVISEAPDFCHITLSKPLLGFQEEIQNFLLADWPRWTLFGSDYISIDDLLSYSVVVDTLSGGYIYPLYTNAGSSTPVDVDLTYYAEIEAAGVTTDAINTVEDGALADSQTAALVTTTNSITPLRLNAAIADSLTSDLAISGTLADTQASVIGFGSIALSVLTETQATTLALTAAFVAPLRLVQPIAETFSSDLDLKGTLADTLDIADQLGVILGGDLAETQATTLALTAAISTSIRLSAPSTSPVVGTLELFTELAESQAQSDSLITALVYPLEDVQTSDAVISGVLTVAGGMVDSHSLTDTLSGIVAVYTVLADSGVFTDSNGPQLTLIGLLADTAIGGDSFATDSQVVYAINADTGAVSEYVFTPVIHGAAFLDGTLFIATDAGLFALDNTTDNGTPIEWEARTGFTNLGSDLLKRILDLNVLGQATGDVGVNLVHNRDGEKVERRYERVRLTRTAARDGLVKTGRGPISVYWQAGVEGIGPAEISELRLRVEPTSRRR